MQFSDMTINGIVVTQGAQRAALKLFLQNDSRRAKDLKTFLEDQGVPVYNGFDQGERLVSNRAADRLLQNARKAGIIAFVGGRWVNGWAAEAFLEA